MTHPHVFLLAALLGVAALAPTAATAGSAARTLRWADVESVREMEALSVRGPEKVFLIELGCQDRRCMGWVGFFGPNGGQEYFEYVRSGSDENFNLRGPIFCPARGTERDAFKDGTIRVAVRGSTVTAEACGAVYTLAEWAGPAAHRERVERAVVQRVLDAAARFHSEAPPDRCEAFLVDCDPGRLGAACSAPYGIDFFWVEASRPHRLSVVLDQPGDGRAYTSMCADGGLLLGGVETEILSPGRSGRLVE
jgi:hypothetical protein